MQHEVRAGGSDQHQGRNHIMFEHLNEALQDEETVVPVFYAEGASDIFLGSECAELDLFHSLSVEVMFTSTHLCEQGIKAMFCMKLLTNFVPDYA